MTKKKKFISVLIAGASLCAVVTSLTSNSLSYPTARLLGLNQNPYTIEYDTLEGANAAARELSNEIASEGTVLLKNKDSALPLHGKEGITVFGSGIDYISGIKKGGFKVFNSTKTNVDDFTKGDEGNFKAYSDAAIVLVSGGTAGEGRGGGFVTSEKEDNLDAYGNPYKYSDDTLFTHKSLAKDSEGAEYKHGKQIGDSTEALLAYAKKNFGKVIVMLTGSSTMEIGVLKDSKDVDAILWVGDLGSSGWQGTSYGGYDLLGDLLNGNITPSGKTNDLWAYDFTSNPTWANDGNSGESYKTAAEEEAYAYSGVSVTKAFRTDEDGNPYATRKKHTASDTVSNYYVVEYEEDIYNGYRYYETADAEANLGNYTTFDYDHAVAYPFGYGLSYTTFSQTIVDKDVSDWGKQQSAYTKNGKMTVDVKVINTGEAAGKSVVEIYGHSPYYKDGISKTENVLLGFEKTRTLRPGDSQTVTVEVDIHDMASFDYLDKNGNGSSTYELDKIAANDGNSHVLHDNSGHYELRLQSDSHNVNEKVTLDDLDNTIVLDKDSSSGETVTNRFSQKDIYNTLSYDPTSNKNLVEEGKMTLLSRSDFGTTFPKIATKADMVRGDQWFTRVDTYADNEGDNYETLYKLLNSSGTAESEDDSDLPWAINDAKFSSEGGDTYAQGETNGLVFRDLQGVDYDNTTIKYQSTDSTAVGYTTNSALVGNTGREAWIKLINEMSYDEMKELVSGGAYQSIAVDSIKKPASRYMDSALVVDQELWGEAFNWGDCPHCATTWNKELMYRRGIISGNIALLSEASSQMSTGKGLDGWYAPAMDLHRTPFGGRTSEYFTEDPILSGTISGCIIEGMASKGIICTAKHCALNESETQRINLQTYLSEQAAREIYFKSFEIVIKDYGCGALMTSYNCIGDIHSDANYEFMNGMIRGEWGFKGFATSDAVNPISSFFTMDTYIRTGNSLLLSKTKTDENTEFCAISGTYDKTKNQVTMTNGKKSNTQWYWLRHAVLNVLYTEVNSAVSSNGYDITSYEGKALTSGVQGSKYTGSVTFAGIIGDVAYTISDGALPNGLSLRTNGEISGTPTETGDFTFTVQLAVDGWIKSTAEFTVSITSSFSIDQTAAPEKDKAYDAYIQSSVFTTDNFDSVSYSVDESALPAGLTMDSQGHITGTPTVMGKFVIPVTVTGSKTTQGWMGPSTTKTIVTYTLILDISGVEETPLTEEDVQQMIDKVDTGLTEDQVNTIVNTATNGKLSQEEVQALIDAAVEANKVIPNNSVAVAGVTVGSVGAATGLASLVLLFLKKRR